MADVEVKNINLQPVASPAYYMGVNAEGKAIRVAPVVIPVQSVVGLTGVISHASLRSALGLGGAAYVGLGTTVNDAAYGNHTHTPASIGAEPSYGTGTTSQYLRGDKTWQTLNKSAVGLSAVDNTADADKPISSATATALSGKEPTIVSGSPTQWWRGDKQWAFLSKEDVGLSDTSSLPEGANLYYTELRASAVAKNIVPYSYANNSAAISAGRTTGQIYTTALGSVRAVTDPSLSLVLDGTTDNGPIISAIFASGVSLVVIPNSAAGCRINTTITLYAGQALVGEVGQSKVLNGCDASPMIVFQGGDATVMDLNITCNGSNASAIFRANTAATSMERVTIQNIVTYYGYIGLDDNGGAGTLVNLRTDRVHFRLHRGPGVSLTKAFAFTELFHTVVDRIGYPVAGNHPGFSLTGFQGVSLYNCEVTGTKSIVVGTTSAQTGFVFSSGDVVFADKCFADTCGGVGISFSNVDYIRLTNSTASLCDGVGMSFSSCDNIESNNLVVGGRNATGAGNFTASIDGLSFSNCTKVNVSTVSARDCTGNGITKSGTSQVFVATGYVLTSNTGRGIVDSSSGAAVFSGGVCTGNTVGNVSLASALQAIYATQTTSGAFLNAQLGPFTG